jgi:probable O-glycosylation ligase (exosortase A-associated)
MVVFGSLPFILARPHIGILVWSWIGYMNPHRLTWGFAYSFPFAQVIAIVTIIAVIFSKDRKSVPLTPITVVLLIFTGWMGVTTLGAIIPDEAFLSYQRVLKIQLMTFLTMVIVTNRKRIDGLIWVIVLSIGFYGVKGGIFTLLTGGAFRVWGPPDGFIAGNNEIGFALLMILPLMFYLRATTPKRWIRLGLLGGIALCAFAIIGTQSRGAFVAGIVFVIYYWWKSQKKIVTALVAIAFVATLYTFMPASWHERMDTIITYEQDESAMGRINAWWVAFNIASDKLLAGGFEHWSSQTFAAYAPVPEYVVDAHSIYFEVLGEHGFIGLALFLLLGALALRLGTTVARKAAGVESLEWAFNLSRMIRLSLVAYASGGAFLGLAYFDLYYHLIAVIVVLNIIVDKETAGAEAIPRYRQRMANEEKDIAGRGSLA